MFMAKGTGKKVAVIDQSGIVMPYLVDTESVDYEDYSTEPVDGMKQRFEELGLDVLVVVSPLDTVSRNLAVASYSVKPVSMELKEGVQSKVNDAVEDYRLAQYEIGDLKQIMEDVKSDISMSTYTLDESGEEKITSSEVYMIISMVFSIIIYMFIAMFSGMVMQSVIEEKASRVVEVLVSSVKATELMFGKIIGVEIGGKIAAKLLIELVRALILILMAIILFHVSIKGGILQTFIVLVFGALCFVGFGIMLSARTQTQEDYAQVVMPFSMPDVCFRSILSDRNNALDFTKVGLCFSINLFE